MRSSIPVPREADIFKVEENGSERCDLAPNSSFVRVQVPVRIVGEGRIGEATFHYSIGSFTSKEAKLLLKGDFETNLRFRVPQELFRFRERLVLEVFAKSGEGLQKVLWAKRYEAGWTGSVPHLEPMANYLEEAPEENG
jgi:hypothetical protein